MSEAVKLLRSLLINIYFSQRILEPGFKSRSLVFELLELNIPKVFGLFVMRLALAEAGFFVS